MNGYQSLREQAAWLDYSNRGKIRVTGEDRARLLHAMSTNHINQLVPGQGAYAFFLNAQGRILADSLVYTFGDSFLLETEPETLTKVTQHLDQYIIADDVTLSDETSQWLLVGIEGPNAGDALMKLGAPKPVAQYQVAAWGEGFISGIGTAAFPRYRLYLPVAQRAAFFQELSDKEIEQADYEAAKVVHLEQGLPRYGDDITERYLVQETQQLHAVHFTKGCYLGQEIVERVRSRAQIHRMLKAVRIQTAEPLPQGTKLNSGNESAGEITSSAYSPGLKQVVALAYVRTAQVDSASSLTVADTNPPIAATIV